MIQILIVILDLLIHWLGWRGTIALSGLAVLASLLGILFLLVRWLAENGFYRVAAEAVADAVQALLEAIFIA